MEIKNLVKFISSHKFFASPPALVGYYFLIRTFFGLNYLFIYGFIAILVLLRISSEKIAMIFFSLCMVAYIFGKDIEANHYLSFVYAFLFISLIKYLFGIFRDRYLK